MLQGHILHEFHVARVKKCQRTREDVSLQHVPETRPGNIFTSVPTLLHAPATCPCYTALQHVPSCGPTLNRTRYISCLRDTLKVYCNFNMYVLSNRSPREADLRLFQHYTISNLLDDIIIISIIIIIIIIITINY